MEKLLSPLFSFLLIACLSFSATAQPQGALVYKVNLKTLSGDRASVECRLFTRLARPGESSSQPPPDTLRFFLPRIVPGIYGAMNFGQYVYDFQALDAAGRFLPVSQLDTNTWEIHQASTLARVRYTVDDTWDDFEKVFANGFYKSAGSMWRRDSVAVINHNCLVGYFDKLKDWSYEVTYRRPAGFFGATSLLRSSGTDTTDVFRTPSYRALVDAPLLYARPDTATFKVANAEVLVAVYAEQSGQYAASLVPGLRTLLEHQKDYLGGQLPVNRYAFLIYQVNSPRRGNYSFDALEHAQSALFLLMTEGLGSVSGIVRDVATHEFFHIVTPLNIHSQLMEEYDFNQPKQSKHLWLYEGMTEYATIHMPVKQGLEPVEAFLKRVEQKMVESTKFDSTLSLTAMSENALARQDQYYNVYLKGALVGLCLDVHLLSWSDGRYGTQELMPDLAGQLGPGRPFAEDDLFDRITKLTDPTLRDFFRRYVEGIDPLPLAEVFEKTGILWENGHLRVNPEATEVQVKLRRAWLGQ